MTYRIRAVLAMALVLLAPLPLAAQQVFHRTKTFHWRDGFAGLFISTWDWPAEQGGQIRDATGYELWLYGVARSPNFGTIVNGPRETVNADVGENVYSVYYSFSAVPNLSNPVNFRLILESTLYETAQLEVDIQLTNTPPVAGDLPQPIQFPWRSPGRNSQGPVDFHSVSSDPDADPIFVQVGALAEPAGCGNLAGDGTFTPAIGFVGECVMAYQVTDRVSVSANTGTLRIIMYNSAPLAADVQADAFVEVPTTIQVLAPSSDPEGDQLFYVSHTPLQPEGCGTASWNAGTERFDFVARAEGVCSFDYTLTDGLQPSAGHITVTAIDELFGNDFE